MESPAIKQKTDVKSKQQVSAKVKAKNSGFSTRNQRFLIDLFGDRVKFDRREMKMYSHDIADIPSLVSPLVGNTIPRAVVQPVSEEEIIQWFPEELKEKHGPGTKSENVYFAGCTASYVENDIAKASVALLEKAGVDFTYLGNEEQMPEMMPKIMDNLLPHLSKDLVPLISDPMIRYLQKGV